MKIRLRSCLLPRRTRLLTLLLCGTVIPAVSADVLRMTLADAVATALEHNRDIQIARKDLDDARARIGEVYGLAFPRLDGSVNYTRNIELPVLFLPPNTPFNESSSTQTIELGSKNSVVAGLSASQALFNAQINTGIQIAKRYREYVRLNHQSTREAVVRDVTVSFYRVLLAKRLVEVSRQSVDLAQAHFDNVREQYRHGTAAEFDRLRAEVQLANARPDLSQRFNDERVAADDFKRVLGLDPTQEIELVGSLTLDDQAFAGLTGDLDSAVDSNTTIRSMKAQEAVLSKNVRVESAAYLPTLSAFASYDYQSQNNDLDIQDYEWVDSFVAGLQLSIPLFNGFQTKNRVSQARISRDRAILGRQQAEDGIRLQIQQAAMKVSEAEDRYRALASSVSQAHRAMEIADVRFQNGVGTQLELLDAQTALARTKSQQALAAFDYFAALADWEQLVGSNRGH